MNYPCYIFLQLTEKQCVWLLCQSQQKNVWMDNLKTVFRKSYQYFFWFKVYEWWHTSMNNDHPTGGWRQSELQARMCHKWESVAAAWGHRHQGHSHQAHRWCVSFPKQQLFAWAPIRNWGLLCITLWWEQCACRFGHLDSDSWRELGISPPKLKKKKPLEKKKLFSMNYSLCQVSFWAKNSMYIE